MSVEIVHAGFDYLKFSIQTDIPNELRQTLHAAKLEAINYNGESIINFRGMSFKVRRTGGAGFSVSSGEFSAEWYFQDPQNKAKNNPGIIVDFSAELLAVEGLVGARKQFEACMVNVTSATLHNWRVRLTGPKPVPPMYLKPTQGDPIYYQYGVVRSWAAAQVGLEYSMKDQFRDFLEIVEPRLIGGTGAWQGGAKNFDVLYRCANKEVRNGERSFRFPLELVQDLDFYYSRQPRQLLPIPI